jgi:hypothetical protein
MTTRPSAALRGNANTRRTLRAATHTIASKGEQLDTALKRIVSKTLDALKHPDAIPSVIIQRALVDARNVK